MCRQSRFDPAGFTQTIAAGPSLDASAVTRAPTLAAIARRLDLEAASAANRLPRQAASMDAAFRARFGGCPADHATLIGPRAAGPAPGPKAAKPCPAHHGAYLRNTVVRENQG
jgi:hypothetical protein